KNHRRIHFTPGVVYFKPRGIPLRNLEEIVLLPEEIEALRLYEIAGLDQTRAGQKMAISQPTFARILSKARKKTAQALITGKAIKIITNK
ncbi:MAG: DUF134 domain-containing protein, partial [Candidatus Shapirobacteria bacterium]|nr:DUF134 domain-containing protein [Candidatus Shapirobacteria bacterium]